MKFGQQLLSEFNLEWGLDAYVGYKSLKELLKDIKAKKTDVEIFFKSIQEDLQMVNLFFKNQETTLYDSTRVLRDTSQEKVSKKDVFECYNQAKAIHRYQDLNKLCFEKIIKKFLKRMGLRQRKKDEEAQVEEPPMFSKKQETELRLRCDEFLETVEDSYFQNPEKVDLAKTMQDMEIVYSESFANGDEILSQDVLEKVWSMDHRSQSRIIDYTDAHYYKEKLRKREQHYACRILCGSTNRSLARNVSRCLGHKSLCNARVATFANGECNLQVLDNIRGDDVFLFQSASFTDEVSLAHAQMELLLLVHTCRLASAARITAVMPYMAYQSKKQPMSAFAQMITKMGVDRILTVDMLSGQIQGYFESTPLDNVKVLMEFVKYFREKFDNKVEDYASQVCIVSPRSTAVDRAKEFADELGCGLATVIRRRKEEEEEENKLSWKFKEVSEIVGDVKGKICIILSCILDEGENMAGVAEEVVSAGATEVYAAAVHGVFAGQAVERLDNAPIEEVVVTDTICQDDLMSSFAKLRVIPVAPLLAECVDRIHSEASLGGMMKARRNYTPAVSRRVSAMPTSESHDILSHLEGVDLTTLTKLQTSDGRLSPITTKRGAFK
eukprot:TRINITY_DN361_c0_g4_i3.p1 TRINITY_DN361_c0_g4~~TRINITY_DN361_c0_g4_i3.p1  ORF type:complete len:635 (+),score=178.66 TRINITY_DN361_c0_g4_i3:75-1907(+)